MAHRSAGGGPISARPAGSGGRRWLAGRRRRGRAAAPARARRRPPLHVRPLQRRRRPALRGYAPAAAAHHERDFVHAAARPRVAHSASGLTRRSPEAGRRIDHDVAARTHRTRETGDAQRAVRGHVEADVALARGVGRVRGGVRGTGRARRGFHSRDGVGWAVRAARIAGLGSVLPGGTWRAGARARAGVLPRRAEAAGGGSVWRAAAGVTHSGLHSLDVVSEAAAGGGVNGRLRLPGARPGRRSLNSNDPIRRFITRHPDRGPP